MYSIASRRTEAVSVCSELQKKASESESGLTMQPTEKRVNEQQHTRIYTVKKNLGRD